MSSPSHQDHANQADQQHSIGVAFFSRYQRSRDNSDLEMAIRLLQEAVEATPDSHPQRALRLHYLGCGYDERSRQTGSVLDQEKAIEILQEAFDASTADDPKRVDRLQDLGGSYHARYLRMGTGNDLEKAVQLLQSVVETTPDSHPHRARRLHALGIVHGDRYQLRGISEYLEIAIQLFQKALDATPDAHADRAHRLQSLGVGYRDRYQRTGSINDLDKAIQLLEQALDATPDSHPARALRLEDLGAGYGERYQRTEAIADIEAALTQFKEGLSLTPQDHPERSRRLHYLGIGYRDRYQRTGAVTDLQKCISILQEAFDTTPYHSPLSVRRQQDLGAAYHDMYPHTKADTDLEKAIENFQAVIDATPEDHPERMHRLHCLGVGYHSRYKRTGRNEDLETAIERYQAALNATPENHPESAIRFSSLGTAYKDKHRQTGATVDLDLALQYYQGALDSPTSRPAARLDPGIELLALHASRCNWTSAHQVASKVMALVPLLTPRSIQNSDKQHLLGRIVGLASDAAAVSLLAGMEPYEAIRLLELGRGVIIGSLNETRVDLYDLKQQHPLLADEIKQLRDELSAPFERTYQADRPVNPRVLAHRVSLLRDFSSRLEDVIQTIRSLPGFTQFLLPPSTDELMAIAASGPVAIINVSAYGCHALIIEKSKIFALELSQLKQSDIVKQATNLNPNAMNVQLLEWLWEVLADPVLGALGFTESLHACWPRIQWIPTGALAKFPIHAAGSYSLNPSDTVMDRVISSYSSSVKVLVQSRQRTSRVEQKPGNAVLIGMPELPFAVKEIEDISLICGAMQLQVIKPQQRRKDTLAALEDCEIFHFAGHGQTDPNDPLQSALLLGGRSLTVADLLETIPRDKLPFLAYLSACGTGQMKSDSLIDESIHLIAACQLAGFRHVVGTLWAVSDRYSADVASATYRWIRDRNLSDQSISEGLHHACRALRSEWVSQSTAGGAGGREQREGSGEPPLAIERLSLKQNRASDVRDMVLDEELPLYWVPYVHFGS